VSEHKLLQPL